MVFQVRFTPVAQRQLFLVMKYLPRARRELLETAHIVPPALSSPPRPPFPILPPPEGFGRSGGGIEERGHPWRSPHHVHTSGREAFQPSG